MDGNPGAAGFKDDERAVVQQILREVVRRRARPGAGYVLAVDEVVALTGANQFAGAAVLGIALDQAVVHVLNDQVLNAHLLFGIARAVLVQRARHKRFSAFATQNAVACGIGR